MFRPLHSLVTVVLDPKVDKTEGGLVIPDTSEATFRTGVVRAVGPSAFAEHVDGKKEWLIPGDHVVIGVQKDRAGHAANLGSLSVDDGAAVLVNYHDIWGILDAQKV
jgi:co-chaperonin GroES (HSP10)